MLPGTLEKEKKLGTLPWNPAVQLTVAHQANGQSTLSYSNSWFRFRGYLIAHCAGRSNSSVLCTAIRMYYPRYMFCSARACDFAGKNTFYCFKSHNWIASVIYMRRRSPILFVNVSLNHTKERRHKWRNIYCKVPNVTEKWYRRHSLNQKMVKNPHECSTTRKQCNAV